MGPTGLLVCVLTQRVVKDWLHFGVDPDHDLDPGFCIKNSLLSEVRALPRTLLVTQCVTAIRGGVGHI